MLRTTRILPILLALLLSTQFGCGESESDTRPDNRREATGEVTEPSTAGPEEPVIPVETPDGGPARFAFEKGVIEMEYQGMLVGTRRTSFDRYGARERTFDSSDAANPPIPLLPPFALSIITPERNVSVDLREGVAYSGPNNYYEEFVAKWRGSGTALGELMIADAGGERLGDTVLPGGYRCRVYRASGSGMTRTVFVYGGVPIGETVLFAGNVRGGYRVVPTRVDFEAEIADSLFEIPAGVEIRPFDR